MPPPPPPPPPPAVPPTQVGSIPAQIVNVGESAVIDVAAYFVDPDGGALSYAASTSSPAVVSVSMSGSSLTMVGVADGTATVTVTATDPQGLSATQSVGVTVQTPNRAPVPSGSIPAQSLNPGRAVTLDVARYFTDPDGDALTYGATTAVPRVVSVSMSGSRLTLVGVADGAAAVIVTATDPSGLIATQSVGVSVQTPNRAPAPVGSIPAQSLNPGQSATLDVASYFSDPDGDALRYAARTSNAGIVSVGVSGSTLTLTGEADGGATVTVTATDPAGLRATQRVGVTVQTPNRAPAPSGAIPAQSILTGRTATLDVVHYFNDPDGDALRYWATTSNAAVVSASMSGSRLTLVGVADGTAEVMVTASDPGGLSATQSVGVTVETPNRAPAPSGSIPAQSLDPGQTARLDVAQYFSDPDGDALRYAARTSNARVVSASVSGSTLTLIGVADGTAAVTVTATDPDGLSATQSVGVTVETPNRAPAPSGAIPAQSILTGRTATLDVVHYFNDPDGDALRYWATTSNAAVVSASMSGSRLTLVGVADGTAAVTVTATDPDGLSATQSVGVTVETPNRAPAPSGSVPAQSLDPGQTATLDVAPYFSDPDGDALGYAATTSNAGVVSASVSGSMVTLTAVAPGAATVTVTATDPAGLSATQRVGVVVQPPNRAPAPSGSIPAQSVDAGRTARLDVAQYFSDPDGDTLTYAATTSDAAIVSVDDVSGSTLTLTGVALGTATVTVTATDPDGLSATQRVSVTVETPNRSPVPSGSIPARSIGPGQAERLDVAQYFRDPDGDALTYAATTSNTAVVSANVSGSTLTLAAGTLGTATVTVTATDPDGLSATQDVDVTVTSNRAPVPSGSIPAQNLGAGRSVSFDVARYFSDPDGDALRYAAETSNAGVVSRWLSRSNLTLVGVAGGEATVTVTASDRGGLTATQTIEVAVRGRVAGFRDDFETSANLQDWRVRNADATVTATATDSALHLTNVVTGTPGTAARSSPPRLRGWELSVEISRVTREATPGVIWFTGHDRFSAFRLLLPASRTRNYEFAVFDGAENGWTVLEDLSGHSRQIAAAPNAFDQIRLAHDEAGDFVFELGGGDFASTLFRVSPDTPLGGVPMGDLLERLVDIWLVNQGAKDATAVFEWVELSGEEVAATAGDADAPPGVDHVRAADGSPAASRVRLRGAVEGDSRGPRAGVSTPFITSYGTIGNVALSLTAGLRREAAAHDDLQIRFGRGRREAG